jgi:NAD(P)-dependent dehydrogenase (short-subunit alcohol dehydrogenase family)
METSDIPAYKRLNLAANFFSGQVVVVTGAGRGIGKEVARAFAGLGARVVIAELTSDGQAAAEQILAEGGQALFVPTDVSDPVQVARLAEQAHQAFGPVDVLVNNAIRCPFALVAEMEVDLWDQVMAVNLRGTFLTSKVFLPEMLARRQGTIINMVSTDAMPGLAAYIASKQGIVGFSQTLDAEVTAQGVRVIPFGPGMVDTPAIRAVAPILAPRLGLTEAEFMGMSLHPAFNGLMPADYAGAATVYLAAALADEFHGQVVNGYEVLERAGLIQPAAVPLPPAPESGQSERASTPAAVGIRPDIDHADAAEQTAQAAKAAQDVAAIITQTEAEFNKLPIFVRPMARAGFKSKSGLSINDWQRALAGLLAGLQERADGGAAAGLGAQVARLAPLWDKLVAYYQGVPAETARFTRDTAFLQEVAHTSAEREAAIRGLEHLLG